LPFMARSKPTRKPPVSAATGRSSQAAVPADKTPPRAAAPIALGAAQKRYLRSLTHTLKPVILVGAKGVTPALLAELDGALEHHELIKVKIAAEDRDARDAWIAEIVKAADAALVQRVGNIASLFRPRRKNPGIVLPR
jgi:RNA-binding protein